MLSSDAVILDRLKSMSVSQRLAVSLELRRDAWILRRSVIAAQHPEYSERELDDAVRAAFSTSHE